MKKIIFTIICATIALSLLLIPCSAFTSTEPVSPSPYGVVWYNTYNAPNERWNIPIIVDYQQSYYYSNFADTELKQRYTFLDDAQRHQGLAKITTFGFSGYSPIPSEGAPSAYPTVNIDLSLQYDWDIFLTHIPVLYDNLFNAGTGFIITSALVIREYSDGSYSWQDINVNSQTLPLTSLSSDGTDPRLADLDRIAFNLTLSSVPDFELQNTPYGRQHDFYLMPFYEFSDLNAIYQNYLSDSALDNSYDSGYQSGYEYGFSLAYDDGYEQGYNDSTLHWEEANFNPFTWVADMVGSFLDMPLIGEFTIGTLLLIVFGVVSLKAILSLIAGG